MLEWLAVLIVGPEFGPATGGLCGLSGVLLIAYATATLWRHSLARVGSKRPPDGV